MPATATTATAAVPSTQVPPAEFPPWMVQLMSEAEIDQKLKCRSQCGAGSSVTKGLQTFLVFGCGASLRRRVEVEGVGFSLSRKSYVTACLGYF